MTTMHERFEKWFVKYGEVLGKNGNDDLKWFIEQELKKERE